ncbi:MAG: acylphosphatase [Deltaproteobacteria bacterium]|nr:acylphosphatase [Deltaproteobacteria bacterium]MBW2052225.1 acylphosphatase [Deltaproteobacteria bacterium]MBW2323483.1 acylphosphatase [Deltaproteobacteria bacterium]
MAKIRARLIISGRVQGVYFRYSTQQEANRLGLTGWARNLRNGDVEAVFEGDESQVEEMIRWCHQGPAGAVVSQVKEERGPATDEFTRFSITY